MGPPKDPGHWRRSGLCGSPKGPRALEEEWVVWVPQRTQCTGGVGGGSPKGPRALAEKLCTGSAFDSTGGGQIAPSQCTVKLSL